MLKVFSHPKMQGALHLAFTLLIACPAKTDKLHLHASGAIRMDSDGCLFSLLSDAAMRDKFLTQAFKQLDQHDLCCVIPFVCHHWHSLAPERCSSLSVTISTPAAAEALTTWTSQHGSKLTSISLDVPNPEVVSSGAAEPLAASVCTASTQLRSLRISFPEGSFATSGLDLPIPQLQQLTNLQLSHCNLPRPTLNGILQLSKLASLTLHEETPAGTLYSAYLPRIASSLAQLSSLTLSKNSPWVSGANLLSLQQLPKLQRLELGRTPISRPEELRALQHLPVRTLHLRTTPSFFDGMFEVLHCSASWLEELELDFMFLVQAIGNDVSSRMRSVLAAFAPAAAPKLRKLRLQDWYDVGSVMPQIADLKQLSSLTLCNCGVDRETAVQQLSALTGLKTLEVELD